MITCSQIPYNVYCHGRGLYGKGAEVDGTIDPDSASGDRDLVCR